MNNKTTWITLGVIVAILAIYGAYQYPQNTNTTTVQQFGTTSQGGTFDTAKFAGVAAILSAPGANATSSSILNTSDNDRFISGIRVGCEGVGTSKTAYTGAALASLTVTMSTTSTSGPATGGTAITAITIATSTPTFVAASSTPATGSVSYLSVWSTGSYLTFTTNATNTASCTFGADYFSS